MRRLKCLAISGFATFIGAFGIAYACECPDSGPFLIASRDAPVIVRGRVLNHIQHGLALEVHQVYRGNESRSVINVWGDNGRLCRKYADQFPDDSEWVFALQRMHPDVLLAGEALDDFQIPSCGEYAVRVEGEKVITFDEYGWERRVSLSELGDRLRSW